MMDGLDFRTQARISGADGVEIGTLVDVDGESEPASLVVRLQSDDRLVRIPVSQVDVERSTGDEVVTTIAGESLLASSPPMSDDERQQGSVDASPGNVPADAVDHRTLPIAEEELDVQKRSVEHGRVVVRKRVETRLHEEPIELAHDEVDVERVPIGRDIGEAPSVREEGDTTVVPVVEEVLVIEKRLRLVEEVRITRRQAHEQTTVQEELRRDVVDVAAEEPEERRDG